MCDRCGEIIQHAYGAEPDYCEECERIIRRRNARRR